MKTNIILSLVALGLVSTGVHGQQRYEKYGTSIEYRDDYGNIVRPTAKPAPASGDYVPGRIIVKFAEGALDSAWLASDQVAFDHRQLIKVPTLKEKATALGLGRMTRVVRSARPDLRTSQSRDGRTVQVPDFHNLMSVAVEEGTDIPALCDSLSLLEGIEYAEPDYLMRISSLSPNDNAYYTQEGLEQANDRDIDVERAWDFTTGSSSIRVGILDTGIDYDHPDLGGSFGTSGAKVVGGYDYYGSDGNPDDESPNSHGTRVASVVGALSNNIIGIAGIAGGDAAIGNQGVKLVALRVGNDQTISTSQSVNAIYDASS